MLDLIEQINLQNFLFSKIPARTLLNQYKPVQNAKYRGQVLRNHSFELVEHTIHAFLDYADCEIDFVYSGYDDSFSFQELDITADIFILWVDGTRYVDKEVEVYIKGRIKFLRQLTDKPILVIPYECSVKSEIIDVVVFDLKNIKDELKDSYKDLRAKKITGTELSRQALVQISRELGLKYLPSLLKPAIKAIVTDFDNTLYKGVLGEDGINGVELSEGHIRLQSIMKDYADNGIFLCAVSKNEQEDVEKLLHDRKDFPLNAGDFTRISASWNSKADSIVELSKFMNIGTDSILFIDDNIGELLSVFSSIPCIHIVQAKEDPMETVRALENYPCLCMRKKSSFINRKIDVIANEERRRLILENSKEDYIKKLGVRLMFEVDNPKQIQRISELANKTNQFIFSYRRYSVTQVSEIIESSSRCVVTVSLEDNLVSTISA